MKLQILFFIAFFTCALVNSNAQNYPYLNASTGNEGQYIVDKDTNIYMFHGSQLEKLDKNFNPIWVKKYNGLDFYSLLLSKTGSIYFIAKDTLNYSYMNSSLNKYIGKIGVNGNLLWMKKMQDAVFSYITITQLLLDRNNNLILSGKANGTSEAALLIKLDTLGNMLFLKSFTGPFTYDKVKILNDSSGFYTCVSTFHGFENDAVVLFTYAENRDSITFQTGVGEYPQFYYITFSFYYKSKIDSSIFYSITEHTYQGVSPRYISVRKHNKNSVLWNKKFSGFGGSNHLVSSFDEDINKNVFFTISPNYGPGNNHATFINQLFKLDSNGFYNGQIKTLLSNSWWPPSSQPESAKLNILNNNKYFYTIIGHNFPANPLNLTFFDSTLISNCSSSTVMTMTNSLIGLMSYDTPLLKTSNTPPYSLTDTNCLVTGIVNFTINSDYCLALNTKEYKPKNPLSIYPNPANKTINISNDTDFYIQEITIFDISGKQTKMNYSDNQIKIDHLTNGIYFIKVETDKGEFSQKFIKD